MKQSTIDAIDCLYKCHENCGITSPEGYGFKSGLNEAVKMGLAEKTLMGTMVVWFPIREKIKEWMTKK